jgi:hypothetical protein
MVTADDAVQPFAVTVTLKTPAFRPLIEAVDAPFDHKKLIGLEPPATDTVAVPFDCPLQVTFEAATVNDGVLISTSMVSEAQQVFRKLDTVIGFGAA